MAIKVDNPKKNDTLLVTIAILLLIAGFSGNYYLATQSVLLRLVIWLILAASALYVFYHTAMGRKAWLYWQEALIEVKKVVWPSKKETIQSTVGVLVMVVIMGIFLWTVDAILVRIVAWLLQHNGA